MDPEIGSGDSTLTTQLRSYAMADKTLKEIKEIIYEIIRVRYSEEGVVTIKTIKLVLADVLGWSFYGEVVLRDGTHKKVQIEVDQNDGGVTEFDETD